MKPLGSIHLQTAELPDRLQFVFGYDPGWGDLAAPPAAFLTLLAWSWSTHRYILAAFFIFAFIALVIYWLNISPARLSVSAEKLVSRGNHTGTLRNEISIPASEVESLRYLPAAEYGPSGLYAVRGGKHICLIPGISSGEAAAIIRLIHKKFPSIERGSQSYTTLQFI